MKTLLQLSVDIELKKRLENFKDRTGIPISRVVEDLLRENIELIEQKFNVQIPMRLPDNSKIKRRKS